MEMKDNNSEVKRFIQNILVVDIGLLIIAGFISLVLNLNFAECLKQWAHEVHHMSLVVWETLLVKLPAVETEDK